LKLQKDTGQSPDFTSPSVIPAFKPRLCCSKGKQLALALNTLSHGNLSPEVSALYFGGISLACEPGAEVYADLAKQEQSNSAIMLDPNIRPSFIQDIDRYRKRLDRMMAYADIVKVSYEDLKALSPRLEKSLGIRKVCRLNENLERH